MDDAKEKLFDPHWNNSITGDADGSYFCSTWKAEEAVCHYRELYHEMADELYGEGSEEALSSTRYLPLVQGELTLPYDYSSLEESLKKCLKPENSPDGFPGRTEE